MGGAKTLREAPGRATSVAKTRHERRDERRDGAKRKVSEGSGLRLALVACRSSLRWRWWQRAIAVMHYCDAILGTHGSCSKSFWDSPLVEGPGRQVHPKTTTFCLVLGFTPSRQPSRAHQSQNDLEQRYSAPSLALPGSLCGTFRPVSPSRFSGLIYCMQCLYGNRGRISGHSDRR